MQISDQTGAAARPLGSERVLVLHNRYRVPGGEERYVEQLVELLGRKAGHVALAERDSADAGAVRAAAGLLRGGVSEDEIADIVRDEKITVVHAHNIHPAFGWRALSAAREAGAAAVLHLHNYRLYCAIGTAFRDGHDCDECAPNLTGAALRHNCRGSIAQSVAYSIGLRRAQQPTIAAVDRFVAPVDQVGRDMDRLGLGVDVTTLPSWLPDSEFVNESLAGGGEYGLFVGRVTEDKGVMVAIRAAAESGVPLRVAGLGPDIAEAQSLAAELEAPVEFLGRIDGQALVAARMGAAFAVVPSTWREVLPLSALESLAAGLPLVTSDRGGLPELTDPELVFASGDHTALAAVMRQLIGDPQSRAERGTAALARARDRFSESAYLPRLAEIYESARATRSAQANQS